MLEESHAVGNGGARREWFIACGDNRTMRVPFAFPATEIVSGASLRRKQYRSVVLRLIETIVLPVWRSKNQSARAIFIVCLNGSLHGWPLFPDVLFLHRISPIESVLYRWPRVVSFRVGSTVHRSRDVLRDDRGARDGCRRSTQSPPLRHRDE